MASAASLAQKSSAKPKASTPSTAPSSALNGGLRNVASPSSLTLPSFARAATERSAENSGGGQTLDTAIRQRFEKNFQRDLSAVRVHPNSQGKVDSIVPGARAITVGNDIYFANGQYNPGSSEGQKLLAHELTHTLQQESAVGIFNGRMGAREDRFEAEARRNAEKVSGAPFVVREQASRKGAQPDDQDEPGFFQRMLIRYVPEVEPILKRGVLNWLQDRVLEGVHALVDKIMEPVRTVSGIAESLSTHFSQLSDWIKKAAASIKKGDCSVLHEAVDYIEQAVSGLISPILDKIKAVGKKIGDFFKGLWDKFGAPIWNEIKKIGGKAWDLIQQFGTWIWDKTKPIRDWGARAWKWVKNKLGIGEGPEGQNGLLQWVEEKAEKAWDWIKEKIEPIKKPLMVVAGILVMLSPAGPIIAVGLAVGGIIEGVRAIKRHFGTRDGVVSGREILRTVVLPKLIQVIRGFASFLAEKANAVIGKLRSARDSMREAARAAGESILSFLEGFLQWIADCLDDFVKWGDEKVSDFLTWVDHATSGLVGFLDRILAVLDEIAAVVKDIMRLPFLLMGKVWKAIPACIRDPFVDFFGVQILGRIAIFKALAGTPEAWAKTKAEVGVIIKEFFVDFDLMGAMKHAFKLLLRALDVPLELLEAVLGKLVMAWDTIKDKPEQFLKNLWGTIKLAFKGFFKRILTHLKNGIVGWLTKSLEGAKIVWPQDWTDVGDLFGFVMSVLGISVDHVLDRIALKYPERAAQLRKIIKVATGAWEWISMLARGDFQGIWEKIKEKISNLYNMVIQGVVDWLMKEVVQGVMMQLLTTADPTGISEIVMFIVDTYRTIKTAVQYMRQILTMMNSMLDSILNIANGVLQPAADLIEDAFDRGMPVVIGFLANLVGLGNIGEGIQEALTKVREKVDEGIDWLIEKAAAIVEKVVGAVKGVVALLFPPEKIEIGEEQHTVTAEDSGDQYGIYVESEKKNLNDFAKYAADTAKRTPKEDLVSADIAKLMDSYRDWQKEADKTAKEKDEGEQKQKQEKNINDFKIIASLIKKIMQNLPATLLYRTKISTSRPIKKYKSMELGGTIAEANPLTPDHVKGVAPGTATWDLWKEVAPGSKKNQNLRRQDKALYYRGHLLSRWLGGGNETENLTPITASANQKHESYVESFLIDLVGEGGEKKPSKKGMAYYKVDVSYDGVPRGVPKGVDEWEGYLPSRLDTVWYQLVPKPGITKPDPDDSSQLIQAGPEHRYTVENVPPYPQTD